MSTPTMVSAGHAAAELRDSTVDSYRARARATVDPFRDDVDTWEREGHLPHELFAAVGAAGLLADRWARGAGGGLPLAKTLIEEMARLNGGSALAMSIHSEVFAHALHRYGGARHARLLAEILAGRAIGCAALTEPGGGSDLYSMRTAASLDGDGRWHLTGTKRYTTNVGRATHALVLARTGAGPEAFTLFVVALDRSGVCIPGFFTTLGMRSADTGGLELDVRLAPEDVVGRPNAGLLYVLKLLDYERIAAATALVTAANRALAMATAYLRERTSFGKRLFDHQALAHRLADRWIETQAATALLDAACAAVQGDHPPHHLVAAAKLTAARTCLTVVDEAIQFLGARGYTTDYPLERMYRDVRLTRIGGGTDEMLRQIICMHLDVPCPEGSDALERAARRTEARMGGCGPLQDAGKQ